MIQLMQKKMKSLMNEEDDHSKPPSLPHHLLSEHILPRVPVKPLLRFKSVSKPWLSTISSPKLAKSQLQFSSTHRSKFILLSNSNGKHTFHSLSYDENNNVEDLTRLENVPTTEGWKKCDVVGTSKGLVCLYLYNNRINNNEAESSLFVIWNPTTCQYRKVTLPDKRFKANSYTFGFGAGDFMIVAWFDAGCSVEDEELVLYAFSSQTGGWRQFDHGIKGSKIEGFDDVHVLSMIDPVLVGHDDDDATIYLEVGNPLLMHVKGVVGLDLVRGLARLVELPDGGYLWGSLLVLTDTLMILGTKDNGSHDVFMLKKLDGDIYAWEKVFFVSPQSGDTMNYYLCFSVNGMLLVYQNGQVKLVDLSKDDGGDCEGVDVGGYVVAGKSYFESLVSPFGSNL